MTPSVSPLAAALGFTADWFALGVVDKEYLGRARWESGEDPNTEHYRYAAFRAFLAARRPLSAELARELYHLGENDPETGMGGAMMADIVRLPECPKDVLDAAQGLGRPHLAKIVARRCRTEIAPPHPADRITR